MANSLGVYQADGSNDIGALEAGATVVIVTATGSTITLAKPTATGLGALTFGVDNMLLTAKPTCVGEARIIYRENPNTPTVPLEDEDNGSLLKMNTKIRRGIELIADGESTPIIDLGDIRYLVDGETFKQYGALIWTRFSISTRQPLDAYSFTRRYAAHNMFGELLYSGTNLSTLPLQTSTFPTFSIPVDNGTTTP